MRVESEKTCGTCQYWDGPEGHIVRVCREITEDSEWTSPQTERAYLTVDISAVIPRLRTRSTFGCILHKPR